MPRFGLPLSSDTLDLSDRLAFKDQAERDIWSLGFGQQAEDDISSLGSSSLDLSDVGTSAPWRPMVRQGDGGGQLPIVQDESSDLPPLSVDRPMGASGSGRADDGSGTQDDSGSSFSLLTTPNQPAPTTASAGAPSAPSSGAPAATAGAPSGAGAPGPDDPWGQKAYAAAVKAGHPNPAEFVEQMRWESGGFDPNVISGKRNSSAGARGIAQIMPATAQAWGVDPLDPDAALDAAAQHMAGYYQKYGTSEQALAAYNMGEGNLARYGARGLPETNTYINVIGERTKARTGTDQPGLVQTNRAAEGETPSSGPPPSTAAAAGTVTVSQAALDDPDKWALCGPVAAVTAAQTRGSNWTVADAKKLAVSKNLWDPALGMHGLESQAALLRGMGIGAQTGPATQDRLAQDAANGNTPIVSTNKHYFVLQGYNPQTGEFDTGSTGTVLRNGKRWMTLAEISTAGGGIQGAAYLDNPTSPAPSTVASAPSAPSAGQPDASGATQAAGAGATPSQPLLYRQPLGPATSGPDTLPGADTEDGASPAPSAPSSAPPREQQPAPAAVPGAGAPPVRDDYATPVTTSAPSGPTFQDDRTQAGWVQPAAAPGPPVPDMRGTSNPTPIAPPPSAPTRPFDPLANNAAPARPGELPSTARPVNTLPPAPAPPPAIQQDIASLGSDTPPAPPAAPRFDPLAGNTAPVQPGGLPSRPTGVVSPTPTSIVNAIPQTVGEVGSGIQEANTAASNAADTATSYIPEPIRAVSGALIAGPEANIVEASRVMDRMQQIDAQAAAWANARGGRSVGVGEALVNQQWRAAHPDLAAEYDELNRQAIMTVGGMVGAGGELPRSGPDATVNASRASRPANLPEEMTPGIVPPEVAVGIGIPRNVPDDPRLASAVQAAGGQITDRGVEINLTRAQDPAAAGGTATRGGVFYEARPAGEVSSYYKPSEAGVQGTGGNQAIPAEPTVIRSPLVIPDEVGKPDGFNSAMAQLRYQPGRPDLMETQAAMNDARDAVRAAAADKIRAEQSGDQAAYQAADKRLRAAQQERDRLTPILMEAREGAKAPPTYNEINAAIEDARYAGPPGSPERAQAIKDLVSRYGGDPNVIDDLMNLRGADSSESAYAIRENIVSANARAAGKDAVIALGTHVPTQAELDSHPAVKQVLEDRFAINKRLGELPDLIDERAAQLPPTLSEEARLQDPQIAALIDEYNRVYQQRDQIPVRMEEAKNQAYRDLSKGRIREVMTTVEARNPTPGATAPHPALETAQRDFEAAQARYRSLSDQLKAVPGSPLENGGEWEPWLSQQTPAVQELQRQWDEAFTNLERAHKLSNEVAHNQTVTVGSSGYALRPEYAAQAEAKGLPGSSIVENPAVQQAQDALDSVHQRARDLYRSFGPNLTPEQQQALDALEREMQGAQDAWQNAQRMAPYVTDPEAAARATRPRDQGSTTANVTPGFSPSRGGPNVGDLANSVGGGVMGAATGMALPADTPEERRRHALMGAAAGMVGGPLAGRLMPRTEGTFGTMGIAPQGERPPGVGAMTTAFGENPGERVQFRFRVLPLEDLITSHTNNLTVNREFPAELQPRIRERAASQQQIDKIMARFDPGQMLVDTHTLDRGPMIVGPDNVVESGNGRTISLRRLAQEEPQKYQRYVDELHANLPDYGLTPQDLQGIDHPVLVRERVSDVNRAQFAASANVGAQAEMAPIERAFQDAGRLSDEHVANLTVNEGQSIDQALLSPDNAATVRAFVGSVPDSERGALLDAKGNLNAYGLERLKSALLAKTYTGEAGARISTAFVESTDPGVRNVENAVYASLPAVARAEAQIASGARDASLSVAPDIATAVDVYARLKRAGMSVPDYLAQASLFGDRETTPVQDQILQYINDNSRSPRRIRDMLEGMAQAIDAQASPDQVGMFGEAGRVTKEELVNGVTRNLGPAPADTGADLGRAGSGGQELEGSGSGSPAPPEPGGTAPAPGSPEQSRQRFQRAQAAAQEAVRGPAPLGEGPLAPTGGPEGTLRQEGAPESLQRPGPLPTEPIAPTGGPEGTLAQPGAPTRPGPAPAPEALRQIAGPGEAAPVASARAKDGQPYLPTMEQHPGVLARVARAAEPWWRRLGVVRFGGMLSDTATHAFNATSNAIVQAARNLETPIAAGFDVGRVGVSNALDLLPGMHINARREVFFSEAPARVIGMRSAAGQGLQNAAEILKTGTRPEDAGKLDLAERGMGTNIPGLAPKGSRRAAAVDIAFEYPLRALGAADAVFRTMSSGGHMAAEATAAAMKANGGKPVTAAQIAEAMKNPDLVSRVENLSRRDVFQEDRKVTNAYRAMLQKMPEPAKTAISVEVPFVRTPYNVAAQGMGLTPVGYLGVIRDLQQGRNREAAYGFARATLGTAVMAYATSDYAAGNLTGPYPDDPKERSTLPPGWQPWSKKVTLPDGSTHYYSLALLGPFAVPAVAGILMGEASKKGYDVASPEYAGHVAMGVGQYAEQQTFFQGLANISKTFDAVKTGGETLSNKIEPIVAQFSPHVIGGGALGREIQRITGQPLRDPHGALDALLATLPYQDQVSEALDRPPVLPRQDVLGRPQMQPGGADQAVMRSSRENDLGVIRAFRRAGEGLPMAAPKQVRDDTTQTMKTLSPVQQYRWRRAFGQSLNDRWQQAGSPTDITVLRGLEQNARDDATQTVLGRR